MKPNPELIEQQKNYKEAEKLCVQILGKNKSMAAKIIQRASTVTVTPDLEEQRRGIVEIWYDERQRLRNAIKGVLHPSDVPTRLSNHLHQYAPGDEPDYHPTEVFRLALAHMAQLTFDDNDASIARQEVRRRLSLYRQLLGDFLPSEVYDQAAEENYTTNSNASALGDWSMFEIFLRENEADGGGGLKTGLPSFDAKARGLSQLTLLAGRTFSGKTTLAVMMALGVIEENPDTCVLFIELELPKSTIYRKILSCRSGVPYDLLEKLGSLSQEQRDKVSVATKELKGTILPRL